MAYTTINKSTAYFDGKVYLGSSSAVTVSGLNFQPDLVWVKDRDNANQHVLVDAVRGAGYFLQSNLSNAQVNNSSQSISAFTTDGFTTGTANPANESGSTTLGFMSWNWKAGTTGSGNTGGSGTYKTYSYSVNTTAGFSIVKYVGNGTSGHTIPHHLGSVPKMIILKNLDNTGGWAWRVYHASLGATQRIFLDVTTAAGTDSTAWNDTAPTSSVFTVGNSIGTNSNNENFIAYCFAEKTGYSRFGIYEGTGNATQSPFVYTGFKPAFVIIKKSNGAEEWNMNDTIRDSYGNPLDANLLANQNYTETDHDRFDAISNGFKIRTTSGQYNASGSKYIYMAFGQSLVGSNNVPCTAR